MEKDVKIKCSYSGKIVNKHILINSITKQPFSEVCDDSRFCNNYNCNLHKDFQ